jgi:hypothetical protein
MVTSVEVAWIVTFFPPQRLCFPSIAAATLDRVLLFFAAASCTPAAAMIATPTANATIHRRFPFTSSPFAGNAVHKRASKVQAAARKTRPGDPNVIDSTACFAGISLP